MVRSSLLTLLLAGLMTVAVACGDDSSPSSTTTTNGGDDADVGLDGGDVGVEDVAEVGVDVDAAGADVEGDAVGPSCVEGTIGGAWERSVGLEVPLSGQAIVRGSLRTRIEALDEGPDLVIEEDALATMIDTGTQITSYDADLLGGSAAFFRAEEVELGTVRLCDAVVKGRVITALEGAIGAPVDVLLGQSMLMALDTTIDYQGGRAWLLAEVPETAPPGMEGVTPFVLVAPFQNQFAVASVGFGVALTGALVEGGRACPPPGCCTAEGCPLMMDTGSEATVITESLFAQLEAAHGAALPRLTGYRWVTNLGEDAAFVTRLPMVSLGGAEVSGEWAVVVPDAYHVRTVLEAEGIFIEGFVGAPHLRHFMTGFRGPDTTFRFWPYATPSRFDGEWQRVGLEVTEREGGVVVDMVFAPSDAATQGVALGDRIVSVDGVPTGGLRGDAVRAALRGVPGQTRALVLSREGEAEPLALDVLVEDLLPPLD